MSQTELSPRAARRLLSGTPAIASPSSRVEAGRAASSSHQPTSPESAAKPVKHLSLHANIVWERVVAGIAVRLGQVAWAVNDNQARSTLLRVASHLVILAIILGTVSIISAPPSARATTLAERQANPQQTSELMNVTASISQTNEQPVNEENLNLVGQGGPILVDQASVVPLANPYTMIPNRLRRGVIQYTVQAGDTLFGIAAMYGLTPETLLWANYDALQDNPHLLKPDMVLNIPPVNGIVYTVQAGDTVEGIAEKYKATADAIYVDGYEWNQLKPGQQPTAGATLIIPGGSRDFKAWALTAASNSASDASGVPVARNSNAGFCKDVAGGLVGTGTFIWPANQHWLSGNPYAPWHPGIDIAAHLGDPIYAADNGVVVYAGWNTWGYGNLVVIDHGNGWQTWYAHNSAIYVECGQNVFQGSVIAAAGSTGRSTGPHLHFETRLNGTLPNPFNVLPPP